MCTATLRAPSRRVIAASVITAGLALSATTVPSAADDVLARSRAVYGSLKSYADTGTIEVEFGPANGPIRERHSFKTAYRAPRHFYFDFVKQQQADRFVIWSDDEAFHTWWQTTGVLQAYAKGQGTAAFVAGSVPTKNSLFDIAPLLFAQAGLAGTLTEIRDASEAGTEAVNGRPCVKVVGTAKSVYQASGHETNIRRTTVWIDSETLLIRKVFEDTPQGTPAMNVSRITTTFEPQANPTLDDSRFRFVPPTTR